MTSRYPIARLGDLIFEDRERVGSFDGNGLPVLGVTNVSGITSTGIGTSADLSNYLRLRPLRFAFNPYRINVGSIGLSAEDQEGIVSPAYVVFGTKKQLDPRYLFRFLKSHEGNRLINFHGNRGTVRSALRFEDLCKSEIPLPSPEEQGRIVARIEQLAAQIEEARRVRQQADVETEALRRHTIDAALSHASPVRKPLERFLAEPLINGFSIPKASIGSGIVFAKVGAVNTGKFNAEETKRVDVDLPPTSPYWLKRGDIVVSRGNTSDLVGRAAVYAGNPPECAFADLLIRIRVKRDEIEPQFLVAFFHSSEARAYIQSQIIGSSSTMPKISQPKLRAMLIPSIPLTDQQRIVAYLDGLHAQVDALKRLQAETAAELDALLPSVLDKAFKGEL